MGCSKKCLTRNEAITSMIRIKKTRKSRLKHDGKPIRYYYCRECEAFHLTSMSLKQFYKIKIKNNGKNKGATALV